MIYCVNRDGYSHHTFFRNTQDQDYSLLIVQDSLGHAFGAFLSSQIRRRSGQYSGDDDAFVFTFHDGEDLEIYRATGHNKNYQLTDNDFLIVGGPTLRSHSRGAIIISDCFMRGHSSKSDTFDNEILCGQDARELDTSQGNFVVNAMEIWGFDVDAERLLLV